MNNNKPIMIYLKLLILLSPLPFGCVGKIFSPLFYILVLVLSLICLGKIEKPVHMLHGKKIRMLFFAFLAFLAFQVLPLPLAILKILSPTTAQTLAQLKEQVPRFHSISMVPAETVIFAAKFLVFALFFWVMINIKWEKREIFSILKVVTLGAVVQVIFGLLKYLQGNRLFFLFFHEVEGTDSLVKFLTGTLGNPNHFAFYLEMVLPLVLALFFLKLQFFEVGKTLKEKFLYAVDENRSVLAYFAAAILLGTGVVLTGSRAGIMTMVFSFMIFSQFSFYLKRPKSVRRKLKYFFIAITAVVLFFGVQNTTNKFMKTSFDSSGRFLRWPATLAMAGDFPVFGSGFGTYRYSFFLYDRDDGGAWSTHAHSDYLEILAEGGVIGSILFLLLVGMLIYSIFRMWTIRGHPQVKMAGIGIVTSLSAAVLHSFFDFSLHIPANVLIFVLVMILGVKLGTYKREFPQ